MDISNGIPIGLFREYYRDEEKTKEVMHDGWYHTGDLAWCDEDGFYWYVGRADDVIKSSGYRIGPFEIESVIMELPYVLECGVSAAPDEVRGQVVKASILSRRKYHTITEAKNGAGAVPIKTDRGWIHIAHGVRNTAAGLRYVLYAFATDLQDPAKIIAEPSGMLLGPLGRERTGDVSNVVFTNGAIADDDGKVYIYYASSDTLRGLRV